MKKKKQFMKMNLSIDMQQKITGQKHNTLYGKVPFIWHTYNISWDTFERTLHAEIEVYSAVSPGRDAPYLTSDVPPVWKHGYVPPFLFLTSASFLFTMASP